MDRDDTNARLLAAADRLEIADLIYTYCRAVDRIDEALGYIVFHEGAMVDYGTIYQGPARGLIDTICASHRKALVHSHQVTNIIVDLAGDAAKSEAYVTSAMRMMHEGVLTQITTRGRYLDLWSRRGGRWGIDRRMYVHDMDELRPVTPASTPPRFALDKSDPSYAWLA